MDKINSVLKKYVTPSTHSRNQNYWHSFHYSSEQSLLFENLQLFLDSTLDEARLNHASHVRGNILELTDLEDLDFLARGVLRRENSGFISYDKQRDHSAHTLYNYLLGFYIYENSKIIRESFTKHFALRRDSLDSLHEFDDVGLFGSIWPYVSLLHDIGYLFEGSLNPLEFKTHNEQIKVGGEVLNEFFSHHFWNTSSNTRIDSLTSKQIILNLCNQDSLRFDNNSILLLADSLRIFPHLDTLLSSIPSLSHRNSPYYDVFDLWTFHFNKYNRKKMSKLVTNLKSYFEYQMTEGINGSGIRVFDHGVASGIIQFQYISYYYYLVLKLRDLISDNNKKVNLTERESNAILDFLPRIDEVIVNLENWWGVLIWATAASALHNALQDKTFKLLCRQNEYNYKNLSYSDDPLTYLGILVDILQEWDRFSVNKNSLFSKKSALQNTDVEIGIDSSSGLIKLRYSDPDVLKKIRDALDESLSGWEKIITLSN